MIKPYIDEFTVQGMKDIVPFKQSLDGLKQLSMLLINDAQNKINAMQQANGQAQSPRPAQGTALKATGGASGATLKPSKVQVTNNFKG